MTKSALTAAKEKIVLALTDRKRGWSKKPMNAEALEKATGLEPKQVSVALEQLMEARTVVQHPTPPNAKLPIYGVTQLVAAAVKRALDEKKAR